MSHNPACVFCKLVAAEIPASVVYENDFVLAFLDVAPLAEGHLLIIPRDHYPDLVSLPPVACAQLMSSLPALGRALLGVTGAAGFNVLINNGTVAGQVVPHLHCHLIARSAGDGLGYRWNPGTYPAGRAAELAIAYQKALHETPS